MAQAEGLLGRLLRPGGAATALARRWARLHFPSARAAPERPGSTGWASLRVIIDHFYFFRRSIIRTFSSPIRVLQLVPPLELEGFAGRLLLIALLEADKGTVCLVTSSA